MVLRREAIEERLKELDEILQELGKYRDITWEVFRADLSQRWIIERGLIAAASVIFDIADHILAGHFGFYAEAYEESLGSLRDREVISEGLYGRIRGLGGFRNILIHRYLGIDPHEVFENFHKSLEVFPRFAQEVLAWLDRLERD
ncbi:MAG: HepT-like ribonuclease domain-containing protein [Chloroflexota bacterium]